MNISIITCHDVYNYGASLQAYALQTYLQKRQNEVSIINYKPQALYNTYDFWYVPKSDSHYELTKKTPVAKFLYCLWLAPKRFKTWRRITPFNEFTRRYLNLTRLYSSYEELLVNPPVSDLYVAGSDQIWNTKIGNGLDKAFYLDFGKDNIKRYSYAASFAMPAIPNEHKEFVKKELLMLDGITVREKTGKEILQDLGFNSEVVVDPVFLLCKEEWMTMKSSINVKKPYVLVYNLSPGSRILNEITYRIAKEKSLAIVNVDAILPSKFGDIRIKNAGPAEFVSLFKNADYIVTDSFHGMSFSIIFNKPFYVHYEHDNNSRIQDLLSTIGLPSYLNSGKPKDSFDWKVINEKMNELISQSEKSIAKMLI